MDDALNDLDLSTLARLAGVTPRAIRYYVQQGLLPSPGTRGPGARYDPSLLDRLQLIKLLQREHWPLSKIRQHLEALDDDGMQRELGRPPELPLRSSESALQYVRQVLDRDRRPREEPNAMRDPGSLFEAAGSASEPLVLREESGEKPERAPEQWQVTKSTWERIRLTGDIELSVRRPLTREQNKQIDRLLEAARRIFSEEA